MARTSATSRAIARVVTVLAMAVAVVGALSLLNKVGSETEPSSVVATSCAGFEAEGRKLFEAGGSTALNGTFAPGDHVLLVIDFAAVDFSWKLSGVLGYAKKVDGFGTSALFTKNIHSTTDIKFIPYTRSITTTWLSGTVSGTGKLLLEIDVTAAGDGALTIDKTSSAPLSTSPRVEIARCNASTRATTKPRGEQA